MTFNFKIVYIKIYSILKLLYHYSPYYKKKLKKIEEINKTKSQLLAIKENKIIADVFSNQYIIHNGPFKGMKYIHLSSFGLLPKILGSYEEPIHGWIQEIIESKKYSNIINIGCAEGFYAVGFALKLPDTFITAYDIDEEALKRIDLLIKTNNINNIDFQKDYSYNELNTKCTKNTLIFCDIEGSENLILDPQKIPNLKYIDLIVESHDFIYPDITEVLIDRFHNTHSIQINIDYPGRYKNYSTPNEMTNDQFNFITDELRPKKMKWLFFKTLNDKL